MALTSKMEAFARAVALKGQSLTASYAEVYDTAKMAPATVHAEASRLAAHPEVAARVQVLSERATAAAVKKATISLEESMGEAGSLLEDAQALGQISAGVAAAALRAKLSGHLSERKEEKPGALDDLDVARLIAMRDAVDLQIQRAKDALAMCGDLDEPTPAAPVTMRRVIG